MTPVSKKTRILALIAVLLVMSCAAYLVSAPSVTEIPPGAEEVGEEVSITYVGDDLSFVYPSIYAVTEREGDADLIHTTTLIGPSMDPAPRNSEGPPSITVSSYRVSDSQGLADWVRQNPVSNFHLSKDALLSEASVSALPAFAYTWDGLYAGRSLAVLHEDVVYVLSVTSMSPDDRINSDFDALAASLILR